MKAKPIIYDEIKNYFKLDEQGNLWSFNSSYNKWMPCYSNKSGKSGGYLRTKVSGAAYLQHRIVYCLHTKQDIACLMEVDHKNGDRIDNKIENLRLVTKRENQQNRCSHRDGRLVGAMYNKNQKNYSAGIILDNGEKASLGNFKNENEAHERYQQALQLTHLTKEEIQKHFGVAQFKNNFKGVNWHVRLRVWQARVTVNGKRKHLGYFNSELGAYRAILNFKKGGAKT